MTYWVLNAVFLVAAVVILVAALRAGRFADTDARPGMDSGPDGTRSTRRLSRRALGITALVLLTLTAVFDNIMIGVGLVDYGDAQISGVRLGIMPIEDFAYTVFAVLALPALWTLLPGSTSDRTGDTTAGRAVRPRPRRRRELHDD